MQWWIIPTKQMDDVIIKYFVENQLSKTARSPQAIIHIYTNYQIATASSTSITIVHKNNLLYCCYLCLHNSFISFLHIQCSNCSQACFHSTFKQRLTIWMHMYVHLWSNKRWQKPAKQLTFGPIFFVTCFTYVYG